MPTNLENPFPGIATAKTQAYINMIQSSDTGQIDAQYFWAAIQNIGTVAGTISVTVSDGAGGTKVNTIPLAPKDSYNPPCLPNEKPYGSPILYDATGTVFKLSAVW